MDEAQAKKLQEIAKAALAVMEKAEKKEAGKGASPATAKGKESHDTAKPSATSLTTSAKGEGRQAERAQKKKDSDYGDGWVTLL